MDKAQRKALVEEWKNRCPEMGVISIRCKATGEAFLGASKDTKADFNSNRFQLSAGMHPNKRLAELWNQYGEGGFELSVVKVLKYNNAKVRRSHKGLHRAARKNERTMLVGGHKRS